MQKLANTLSPLERKIIPFLKSEIKEIEDKSGLDKTSVLRALRLLEAKGLVKFFSSKKRTIRLGTNGIYYRKNQLPERTLLHLLENNNHLPLQEAKKLSKLSDNEFKVSLGVLKSKDLLEIKEGKLVLTASRGELTKKTIEEQLLEALPLNASSLHDQQKLALFSLQKRKNIIEIQEKSESTFELTETGEQIAGEEIKSDLLEEVTPELIKTWKKNKPFRQYDIHAPVPKLNSGRKHFVTEAIEKGKRIWLDLGFKEMTGSLTQTSFWNFDALFTAQDHPVREMQDTFFIKNVEGKLPKKSLVKKVKRAHEQGVEKSKGWNYRWNDKEAKLVVLRTHTTCLSAQTLAKIDIKKDLPAKYFAIGRNFRNETVDWSHGFEFNQSEGIVIDKNLNFSHLLGYLKEFYKKMGFTKIRFTPAYFPYTEPSVEINAFHPEKQRWLELGGAGIFRPEVTAPLLGESLPVLAWGPGFDRLMMLAQNIKDLREVYKNDLKTLRERKIK